MAQHSLNVEKFKQTFPEFAGYTDSQLEAKWDVATAFIAPWDNRLIRGNRLQTALYLMMAHLIQLAQNQPGAGASGGGMGVSGVITGATIDKVSVQLAAPTTANGWQYWLSTTGYGLELWALLKALSGAGLYIGGSPERAGFRKVMGRF